MKVHEVGDTQNPAILEQRDITALRLPPASVPRVNWVAERQCVNPDVLDVEVIE